MMEVSRGDRSLCYKRAFDQNWHQGDRDEEKTQGKSSVNCDNSDQKRRRKQVTPMSAALQMCERCPEVISFVFLQICGITDVSQPSMPWENCSWKHGSSAEGFIPGSSTGPLMGVLARLNDSSISTVQRHGMQKALNPAAVLFLPWPGNDWDNIQQQLSSCNWD